MACVFCDHIRKVCGSHVSHVAIRVTAVLIARKKIKYFRAAGGRFVGGLQMGIFAPDTPLPRIGREVMQTQPHAAAGIAIWAMGPVQHVLATAKSCVQQCGQGGMLFGCIQKSQQALFFLRRQIRAGRGRCQVKIKRAVFRLVCGMIFGDIRRLCHHGK
jgi:hypothetical protein